MNTTQIHPPAQVSTRRLRGRHLQFMALGGAIGAGFLLGSGVAISEAGPSLLISYILAGTLVFFVIRALAELTLAYPSAGSFSTYAAHFIGPWSGFITGWSYWLGAVIVCVAECTGVGVLLHDFLPWLPQWIPALMTAVILFGINLCTVRLFGELEYWLAGIKVVTIGIVLLAGLVIVILHRPLLGGGDATIRNLWTHGGFFPRGAHGLFSAIPTVLFAFAGMEVLGLAANDTERVDETLPKAVNGVFYRIFILYVGSLLVIMSVIPWNRISSHQSPFVSVIALTGLPGAATIVGVVAISAIISSCNSGLYAASRMLYGLASTEQAPKLLQRVTCQNIPSLAISITSLCVIVGALLNYFIPKTIFHYALTATSWLILWAWASILLSHWYYFRQLPERERTRRPLPLPGAPYSNIVILIAADIVAIFLASTPHSLLIFIFVAMWFALLTISFRWTRGVRHRTDLLQ